MKASNPQIVANSRTAVVIGAAIGYGLSYAILFASGLIFLWYLVGTGVPGNEAYAKAYESTGYLVFAHALGFVCLMPGGYWAAKISPNHSARNSVLAGVLVVAFSALANFMPYNLPIPAWSVALSIIIPVPAFMAGAAVFEHAV